VYFSHKFSYMLRKVISFIPRKNHFHLLQENPIKNLNPNRNLTQFPTAFIFSIFVKYEMKGKNTTLQHNVIHNISLLFIKHACMQLVPKSEDPSIKQMNMISFQTKFQGSPLKAPYQRQRIFFH
jgi:hypothetical protein